MIRVLVVDDSTTARILMLEVLGSDPEFQVVGEAEDGEEAVRLARRLRPDLVTMDIQMPRMDGFEATRRIVSEAPTSVVVVSALDSRQIELSLDALRVGALAVMPKPVGPSSPSYESERRRLLTTLKAMAGVRIGPRTPRPQMAPPRSEARGQGPRRIRVIGMAASTGGPVALRTVLSSLPAGFSCPILIVQHIAIGFADGFAQWLDAATPLRVKVAANGDSLEKGMVLVAPDDGHLGLAAGGAVQVNRGPPIAGLRPSGTFLFETLAQHAGAEALGVILTGMGRDGTDGLRALRAAGGTVIAQDEETSDLFGMPKAAIDAGVVDSVFPLGRIAAKLVAADLGNLDDPGRRLKTGEPG